MRFTAAQPRSRPREAVVPMINVVFLLLIFFLISASIGPNPPFDLTLPEAEGDEVASDSAGVLFVAADGTLAFGGVRGPAALTALAAAEPTKIDIRADRETRATDLAALLPRLAGMGIRETRLITVRD